jgi:hypothetical protein
VSTALSAALAAATPLTRERSFVYGILRIPKIFCAAYQACIRADRLELKSPIYSRMIKKKATP